MKKRLLLTIPVLAGAMALAGCGGGDDAPEVVVPETPQVEQTTNEPAPAPEASEDAPSRDFGGLEIVVGTWWDDYDTDTFVPSGALEEAVLDMRRAAEQRYNFRVRELFIAPMIEIQELAAMSIMAGDPYAHVMAFQPMMWGPLHAQGMFAPLVGPSIDFNDTSQTSWVHNVVDATRRNGNPYGYGYISPVGGGIYWNLRLFEEAGLDPELPFDLLMAGQWTWDAFMDILRTVNRDTTNDGVIDAVGFAALSEWTVDMAVASNNAPYVISDPATGNLVNNTNSPEFLEALDFTRNILEEGLMVLPPDGSEWNWPILQFSEAQVAMTVGFDWMSWELQGMTDTIGFVPFPMGPNANNHTFIANMNLYSVPITHEDMVDDIMFIMNQWLANPPGFDDDYAWMSGAFIQFHHPRSVEDSLAHFNRNPALVFPPMHQFVPGLEMGPLFGWEIWDLENDTTNLVEAAQLQINSILDEHNNQ